MASNFSNMVPGDIRTEWFLRLVDWSRALEVAHLKRVGGAEYVIRYTAVEEELTPFSEARPSFTLSQSEAQRWMDELWRAGFRPNDGESTLAHIGAMQDHITTLKSSHDVLLEIAKRTKR